MSKKLISLLLAVLMLVSFAACEKAPAKSDDDDEESTTTTETSKESKHTHKFADATCSAPKTCECGETIGTPLGHSFESATCTSPKICNRCGATEGDALGHNYTGGSCTTARYCSVCGASTGDALGHTYKEATCTEGKICLVCGDVSGEGLGHNYVNDKCSRCGTVDPDSVPDTLNELHVISMSTTYESGWRDGVLTDSFGDHYTGYFLYSNVDIWPGNSVHNLNQKYTTFSGSIVTCQKTDEHSNMVVYIYVDDVLVYTSPTFNKTTGRIDFSVNVNGGQKLNIQAQKVSAVYGYSCHLAIVNTQLTKK